MTDTERPAPMTDIPKLLVSLGTRLMVTVEIVIPGKDPLSPRAIICRDTNNGGHVIVGVKHDVVPREGHTVMLEFQQGGPYAGYWKAIAGDGL